MTTVGKRVIVVTALLVPLLGILIFLFAVFQPFANAAGGCGGG
ncbi:MAG TPA: hypothetical protein VMR14_01000 [Streptosporangiaceae bacterium]|jgi:hypothetical protein|nr:hypothetical protein [Streptosporangiaceae bacterium]